MKTPFYMMTLVTLLGIALLWEGIQLYERHLDRISGPSPESPAAAARPATAKPAAPRALLPADDLCLKARLPGPEGLAAALARIPTDPDTLRYGVDPGIICTIDALGDHAGEDPDRIRTVLTGLALASSLPVREAALRGLARTREADDLPAAIRVKVVSGTDDERRFAVRAALALGAVRTMPELIERAAADPAPGVRSVARAYLEGAADPASARIAARVIARAPQDNERRHLFTAREALQHDLSPALAEVALDDTASVADRAAALTLLAADGDIGVLPMLQPLRASADPAIRSRAEAACLNLEQRRARGVKSEMKPPGR